jgi:hypothetical protein
MYVAPNFREFEPCPSTIKVIDRRQPASPHRAKGPYYVVMALVVVDGLNSEAFPDLNLSHKPLSNSA